MNTCPDCNQPGDHIHLDPHDIHMYEAMHNAGKMHAAGAEIERTRAVNIHDHADLLDHLRSDNGHMMGKYANYRNTHQEDEHIPNVRPMEHEDRELTHQELIALHHHDHNKYPEEGHTTLNGEHFHH
jgi:hypothetical protein